MQYILQQLQWSDSEINKGEIERGEKKERKNVFQIYHSSEMTAFFCIFTAHENCKIQTSDSCYSMFNKVRRLGPTNWIDVISKSNLVIIILQLESNLDFGWQNWIPINGRLQLSNKIGQFFIQDKSIFNYFIKISWKSFN